MSNENKIVGLLIFIAITLAFLRWDALNIRWELEKQNVRAEGR